MVDIENKTESTAASESKIVEKRVKSTIIRRRKVKVAKKEPEVHEKVGAVAPVPSEDLVGKQPEIVEEKETPGVKSQTRKTAASQKRKGLTIIAQPPEEGADKETDVVTRSVVTQDKTDNDADKLLKKPARKRKTKAELALEDIQKEGGLKEYARAVISPGSQYMPSRVFEPGARSRKRKVSKQGQKKTQITEPKAIKKIIKIAESIPVSDLSQAMGVKANEIIKKLMGLDIMATVNQAIDHDTATLIATEYGYEVENVAFKEDIFLQAPVKAKEDGESRPPVVTVMGHVDHGKTSILDVIRKSAVAEGEAGGITQHIAAYTVNYNGKAISFVDTPGHEAFTHMRARGAKVTDIVILVVAADDGVMPQTREAIDHSRAAGVPIIVAINKIDKANANLDKVKRELSEVGLQPEDWGGDTICVPTSAIKKEGIDQLLEMVLLQTEMLELKAPTTGNAEGIVIEARMDKRRGPVVTAIVKRGTLKKGDAIVSGPAWGKARALLNDRGEQVDNVLPSQPVEILGLSEVPEAGELFSVVNDEKTAKLVSENRVLKQRDETLSKRGKITLEDLTSQMSEGEVKELNIIIKTDVKGVSDAVKDSLPALSTKDVKIKVLLTGVGGIKESDVMLAAASNAVILGFNVVPDVSAKEIADREGVDIKRYSVIYEMLDDVKKAVAGLLAPKEIEKALGRAEVRETFKVPKMGLIAGCMVTSGKIIRSARMRLLRDNVIIHDGQIGSLKRFKDDAKEVASGMECGIGVERFNDVKVGDEIEAYIIEKIATTWEESKEG